MTEGGSRENAWQRHAGEASRSTSADDSSPLITMLPVSPVARQLGAGAGPDQR